jgi:ubiquinol-cytochrome c reductase cytochrome c subunit
VRTRTIVLIASTAAGFLVLATAWALRPPAQAAAVSVGPTARAVDVEHVYLRDCAQCHGADGRGTHYGPDLRHAGSALIDWQLSTGRMPIPTEHASEPQLAAGEGQQPRRPPHYDPSTRRALVEYVTTLTDDHGAPIPVVDAKTGNLAVGGTLYRLQCAACHAWSGNGGALLHREAPSTHPATALQIAEAVRAGPGNMPRFGNAAVTNNQLDSLVRYVRYLDHPDDRGGNPLWHLGPLAEGAVAIVIGLGAVVVATRRIGTRT